MCCEDQKQVRKEFKDASSRADVFEERLDDLLKTLDSHEELVQQVPWCVWHDAFMRV